MNEGQKKKVNQSIFNSEITDKNTPVNAIRRRIVKKTNKVPNSTGVIPEQMEEEDDQYEEVEEQSNQELRKQSLEADGKQQLQQPANTHELAEERVSVEDSSDEEKPAAKDKQQQVVEIKGYNAEDIDKGKQLMANPNFKTNLDRLRSQFKAKQELQENKQLAGADQRVQQIKTTGSEVGVEIKTDLAMKQSDVVLGKDEKSNETNKKSGLFSIANRGVKDLFKGKKDKPKDITKPAIESPKDL